jgi:MprA protease rhombosortase-interaction domain-containing protein
MIPFVILLVLALIGGAGYGLRRRPQRRQRLPTMPVTRATFNKP